MPFTWVQNINTGVIKHHDVLQELRNNADWADNNTGCSSHNTGYDATHDTGKLSSHDTTHNGTNYSSVLSGHDSSNLGGHDTSAQSYNLVSQDSGRNNSYLNTEKVNYFTTNYPGDFYQVCTAVNTLKHDAVMSAQ